MSLCLARALSFFPLTAPVAMLIRLGGGDVPALDLGLSAAIVVAATIGVLWLTARLLRLAVLMRGKSLTAFEILRGLRAG